MVYGIKPWELDLFTEAELEEYVSQLPRQRPGAEEEG